MDKVFIIGGTKQGARTDSCSQFDTKDYKWKEVARMKQAREYVACAVFERRLVVSGGWDNNLYDLNSVESYDVSADTWSPMPNMLERREEHSLIVNRNKLFAMGGYFTRGSYEVFESISNKFVSLRSPYSFGSNRALSIGSKLFIFQKRKSFVLSYDVDEDEWSEEPCKATKNIHGHCCVKLPIY